MGVDVTTSGPIVDGRGAEIIQRWRREWEDHWGRVTGDRVHRRLATVLRHPTGYAESRVHTERVGDGVRTDMSNLIYGLWLEGVGSRNSPVTRFPGYHTFRDVGAQLQQEVGGHADQYVEILVDRLEG